MTSKTSEQLRAEVIMTIYGIDPVTLLVAEVAVTRGNTITLTRPGRTSSSYGIKGGKPPFAEVGRVFGLTDLVVVSPPLASSVGEAQHASVSALHRIAERMRVHRGEQDRDPI